MSRFGQHFYLCLFGLAQLQPFAVNLVSFDQEAWRKRVASEMKFRALALLSSIAWLLLIIVAAPAQALLSAPKSELWERWTAHDETSTATVDHSDWTRFLADYLEKSPDGINRMRYADVNAADRERLDGYIAKLTST
ncbi:MAG: hypothetical protein OEM98_08710, partial [Gammaproteobacteria bacterium]|nr:hypothetical protein [Gammaproteobacteria bacterium]